MTTIPTNAQTLQCFIVGYWLTKMYVSVNLMRLDKRTGNIFMLAGEEIEIEIEPNGEWMR